MVVVVPPTVKSPGTLTAPALLIDKRATPPVINDKVSDPPDIPELLSELKLNAGLLTVPSGALLNRFA